ncbi:flagellar assembly protein A, partial [Pseudoalteromonas sp. CAL494-MNA-CIBAN-0108]
PRALDTFLGQQFEQPAGSSYSAIIAHGRNPKEGSDAKFVRLCSTAQDRVLSPQAKEGGKVDMKNLGAIITVKPGTPLMQRIA